MMMMERLRHIAPPLPPREVTLKLTNNKTNEPTPTQPLNPQQHLHNLRRCSLSDNEISVVEGLDKNLRLEDLNLENNRIASIDNIFSLVRLKKLELGHNRITKIPPMGQPTPPPRLIPWGAGFLS